MAQELSDGRDALSRLINGMAVDLIIADLQLLNMDGIEFALSIRQHPDHRYTPIVMLTNDGGPAAARRKYVVGVDVWLVKPFKARHLLDALAVLPSARRCNVVEQAHNEAFSIQFPEFYRVCKS